MSRDVFKLVTDYPVTAYRCEARAGDRVRLQAELTVRDRRGRPVRVHLRGEVWTVLRGATAEPVVVWLRQPDGEEQTWPDDADFLLTFEILPRPNT